MQFLKTLFWIVLTVIAVAFAFKNWTPVTILLWGNIVVDVKLPILMFAAFLIGLLPTYIFHRAIRWRLRRRLENIERTLGEVRGDLPSTAHYGAMLPPGAVPTAVPPGV